MDQEFDQLRREFLAEAEAKVKEIESAWQQRDVNLDDSIQRMIYLSHQLKGAGGSYGFQTISREAEALETALEDKGGASDQAANITRYVQSLTDEISNRLKEFTVAQN